MIPIIREASFGSKWEHMQSFTVQTSLREKCLNWRSPEIMELQREEGKIVGVSSDGGPQENMAHSIN